jgi:hypothetical protein
MSNKKTTQFVAAVFSMRKRWLERNPEAARLRIRVISKNTFDKIQNGDAIKIVLSKKYRRWVGEDPVVTCDSELNAWESAIQIRDSMIADGRKVDLNFVSEEYRLYVIEMDPRVAENRAFKKMNSMIANPAHRTCVYVGLTSQAIKRRYAQHRSTTESASTQWGKKFFLKPFGNAYRGDFVRAFADAGNDIECLNKCQALKGELELRRWLQSEGIAAYSK